jgi:hypothetical protein
MVSKRRELEIQAKLHRWARDDPHRRFIDLFNLFTDPGFLLVAWVRGGVTKGGPLDGGFHCGYRSRRLPRPAGRITGPQFPAAAGAGADDP